MVTGDRQQDPDEGERTNQDEDEGRNESAEGRGLRGTFDSVREGVGRSYDRLTGAESRRQFEEFTNVVTTTVLGIHRDQSELMERLARVEHSQDSASIPRTQKLVVATVILSLAAVILSIIALERTL